MTTTTDDLDFAAVQEFFDAECARRLSFLRGKCERQAEALRLLQEKRCVEFATMSDGEINDGVIVFAGERWIPQSRAVNLAKRAAQEERSWASKRKRYWEQHAALGKIAAQLRISPSEHSEKCVRAVAELVQENRRLRAALKMKLEERGKGR